MNQIPIQRYMTSLPHTIGHDQSLATAHRLMKEHGIRHLPVLRGGRLLGIVSERDLDFIESLKDVDPEAVNVTEAMTVDIYTVSARDPLRDVAVNMAEQKCGSAIVLDRDHVVGIFTTVDALRALSDALVDADQEE